MPCSTPSKHTHRKRDSHIDVNLRDAWFIKNERDLLIVMLNWSQTCKDISAQHQLSTWTIIGMTLNEWMSWFVICSFSYSIRCPDFWRWPKMQSTFQLRWRHIGTTEKKNAGNSIKNRQILAPLVFRKCTNQFAILHRLSHPLKESSIEDFSLSMCLLVLMKMWPFLWPNISFQNETLGRHTTEKY